MTSAIEIPKEMFGLRVEGLRKVRKLLERACRQIVTVDIKMKDGKTIEGVFVAIEKDNVLVQSMAKLSGRADFAYPADLGIVRFSSDIKDALNTTPPILRVSLPKEALVCDRRRYPRVRVKEPMEAIIIRENGHSFLGKLRDLGMGGFSVIFALKDKYMEYIIPLIGELVRFSFKLGVVKKSAEINGTATIAHYSIDASGKYTCGLRFKDIDADHLMKISKYVKKKI